MRALIVEDEIHGINLIKGLLSENFPDITILGAERDVEGAIASIETHKPDLVFLDIEIQGGDGFAVLDSVKHIPFKVIFCTGYNEYAIRAFKYSALDYLTKPISSTEFAEAVMRARQLKDQEIALENLRGFDPKSEPRHLIIPERNGYMQIKPEEIMRITADGAYSCFELKNGSRFTVSRSLGYYEDLLSPQLFVRVHHSAIVNIDFIRTFDLTLGVITLQNGTEQEVSVRKRKLLKNHLTGLQ